MTGEDRHPDSNAESTGNRPSSGDDTAAESPEHDEPETAGYTPTDETESPSQSASRGSEPTNTDEAESEQRKPELSDVLSESTASEPWWRRLLAAETGPLLLVREVGFSLIVVLLIGGLLFGLSGVWPPMVAVESQSMQPNINQYDLVFVTDPGRFTPDGADELGVVTAESVDETEYASFNSAGSVVVFDEPGAGGPPIIHRAHFFVEADENWYDRANPNYLSADSCDELQYCPAPHAGYITKGDNDASNSAYDQANGIAPVVRPQWVTGVARLRIPYMGYIRLALTGAASSSPLLPVGLGAIAGTTAYAIGRRGLSARYYGG